VDVSLENILSLQSRRIAVSNIHNRRALKAMQIIAKPEGDRKINMTKHSGKFKIMKFGGDLMLRDA
jgi:hypothetical protein